MVYGKLNVDFDMDGHYIKDADIEDCNYIYFQNSDNRISDSGPDLRIRGDAGIRLRLDDDTGGIFVTNCSAFRPGDYLDPGTYPPWLGNENINLGMEGYYWKRLYTKDIKFSDGTIQTTAGGGGGSWVGTATSDLHMGYYDIYDIQFLRWDGWLSINFDGSTLKPTYDCIVNLGGLDNNFYRVRTQYINGTLRDTYCDVGELQFVDEDCEPGTIVELHDWENKGEEELFNKEFEECMEKKDCNIRFYGLQGRWKRASKNSTKCPSVVSTVPAVQLGTTSNREPYYENGKMNYVALSGSVPNVFVEGKFKSGDILVSAGNGKATVNNDAKWNQALGYTKRSGENERCEIWVR